MHHITLCERYKDRHGWDYRQVGTAKITPVRRIKARENYDEASLHILHATVPAGQSRAASVRGLRHHFTTQDGCGCPGDCCGCPSSYADVIPTGGRRFLVRIHTTLNY